MEGSSERERGGGREGGREGERERGGERERERTLFSIERTNKTNIKTVILERNYDHIKDVAVDYSHTTTYLLLWVVNAIQNLQS